jgi:hypothetical protein
MTVQATSRFSRPRSIKVKPDHRQSSAARVCAKLEISGAHLVVADMDGTLIDPAHSSIDDRCSWRAVREVLGVAERTGVSFGRP